MNKIALAATTLALTSGAAMAGGLDRSYTPVDIIFEDGNLVEFTYGFTMPDATGTDFVPPNGNRISNVADDFGIGGIALKYDFGERFSFALIYDQPYGADIAYGGNPASTMLGGTRAEATSGAMTALLKYNVTDRVSIYGGPRVVKAEGDITLSGLAYGGLSGYKVRFDDSGTGFVLGAAYEVPDIALRVSGTYHSPIDMQLTTIETFPGGAPMATGKTMTELPQSFELAAQTGIAQNTLLFGSIRWSDWAAFTLDPPSPAPNLAELDETFTYELGVGRRFSDRFSGSVSVSYEAGGSDDLVSPLAPTNGQTGLSVGGKYELTETVSLSGGLRYTWLGDARPETGTPDTPRASFDDNNAVSVGLKLSIALN